MKFLNQLRACVITSVTFFILFSISASAETTCEFVSRLGDLAALGEVIDHKTDISVDYCTIQVAAKIDKSNADETKVDFKIDQSCDSGPKQFTGVFIQKDDSPESECSIDYDNPDDNTSVGEDTTINDVPELAQLIQDALDATDMQFPEDPIAQALVAALQAVFPSIECPCWTEEELAEIDGILPSDEASVLSCDAAEDLPNAGGSRIFEQRIVGQAAEQILARTLDNQNTTLCQFVRRNESGGFISVTTKFVGDNPGNITLEEHAACENQLVEVITDPDGVCAD